jgi:hypothetical protein
MQPTNSQGETRPAAVVYFPRAMGSPAPTDVDREYGDLRPSRRKRYHAEGNSSRARSPTRDDAANLRIGLIQ